MGATITESINISVDENVNVNDAVGITDVVTVALVSFVSAFSPVGTADAVEMALENFINVNDSVVITEDVSVDLFDGSLKISVNDTVNVDESVDMFTSILYREVFDSVAISESIGISVFIPSAEVTINVNESVFVGDFPSVLIPQVGDRFWVFESPAATGAWVGHNNEIAICATLNPTTWTFVVPKDGYTFYSKKHKRHYFWNGSCLEQMTGSEVVVISSFFTAGAKRLILVDDDAAGTVVLINLPPINNSPRTDYEIKKIGSTADVIITGHAGQTIDGEQILIIDTQFDSRTLELGTTEWSLV